MCAYMHEGSKCDLLVVLDSMVYSASSHAVAELSPMILQIS